MCRLNGIRVGESGINALVALACGVPVGLITGDRQTIDEADPFLAGAERTGVRTVSIHGDDPLAMFRSFVAVTYITRVAEGRLGGLR